MLGALYAFGKDGTDQWSDGVVAMGRLLTRLVPEDAFDQQPIVSGRYTVVADARLDDREGLARDLGLRATDAAVMSDAAMLAAALEKWGPACLERLVGVFALAAWDARERVLLLARDPFGQRPLVYHHGGGVTAFSSLPRGLHALAQVPPAPDAESLAEFLAGVPPTTARTYFDGVLRVLPGHYCEFSAAGERTVRYWNPSTRPLRLSSHQDYVEGMRHHLDVAVASQLRRASGAVGAHLSGGLDSAAVATTAARLLAATGERLLAFTSVPREDFHAPDSRFFFSDEGPRAAATAALHSNIDHLLVRADRSPVADLDEIYRMYGEPHGNLSNCAWIHAIYDAARQRGVSVLLLGVLGNTTISYGGGALLPELVMAGRLPQWWRIARRIVRRRTMNWGGVLMNSFGPWFPPRLWLWGEKLGRRSALPRSRWSPLRLAVWRETMASAFAREEYFDLHGRPSLTRPLEMGGDDGAVNKGVLGAWGIDCRDPTADQRLARFSFSVPNEQFLYDGEAKALIKHALADRVAPIALAGNKKGFQAADWYIGLSQSTSQLSDELERIEEFEPASKLIDVERLRNLVNSWPTEGWDRDDVRADYRSALLHAISGAHFLRKASGSNR